MRLFIINPKFNIHMNTAESLYTELKERISRDNGYAVKEWEDGTIRLEVLWGRWWKLRYILDETNHRAYEIIDSDSCFVHFSEEDIDWDSLQGLSKSAIDRAKKRYASFPFHIGTFENDVAEVSWQLNPDGMYYMDDDGYGMTDDEEITVYGFIDRQMNVLARFRYVGKSWEYLKIMRKEAEWKLHS